MRHEIFLYFTSLFLSALLRGIDYVWLKMVLSKCKFDIKMLIDKEVNQE